MPPVSDATTWWTAFGAIAQAAGAVATFAAVVVTLRLASHQRSLRASATVQILVTFAGDGSPGIYHVGFVVLNTGLQSFRVSSVGWRTGWIRRGPDALSYRMAVDTGVDQVGVVPPFELEPNRSAATMTPLQVFKDKGLDEPRKHLFVRRVPILGWAPIYGVVSITGRKPLYVRVHPDLAYFLRTDDHAATTAKDGLAEAARVRAV